jgi:hypothetical protein
MIFKHNVVQLFQKYDVPFPEFDHLTVDIDMNTFHLAREVLAAGYRPRSLIMEINRNFNPKDDAPYTTVYSPMNMWRGNCYFGASLLALTRLAAFFDYTLVAVDSCGVNAYYVSLVVTSLPACPPA